MADFDRDLDDALKTAHLPALLASLVHITGDASWLKPEWTPVYVPLSQGDPGLPAEVQDEIRAQAKVVLKKFLEDGKVALGTPDERSSTPIPAAGSTTRTTCTAIRSSRTTPGRSTSRRSLSCSSISATSPRSTI
jgi:hypothetical protein